MPLRQPTPSWSPLLLHSAVACCSPTPPNAVITHRDPASASNHRDDSASVLHDARSIPSLRSLQISSSASFSYSGAVAVASYRLLLSLASHPCRSASTSLAVPPAGKLLYSASHSGVAVYDLESLHLVETFRSVAAGAIKALAFSPDGRVFTAHQDSRIRVWRSPTQSVADAAVTTAKVEGHRLLASLPTVADRLRRFALPGNYVAVRRHRKRLWIEHADAVAGVAVGGGLLYSVSWDKTLKVWRASDLRCLQSVAAHDDAVNAVAVAPDGTVYTGSADRRIRVWQQHPPPPDPDEPGTHRRWRRYALVATLEEHRSAVNALALSPDGGVLCSGACDRSILVWERAGAPAGHMVVVGAIRGHRRAIMCLAIANDLLVSGSTDRTVRVWRRTPCGEYRCLAVLEGHAGGVRSVAAHPVGRSPEPAEEEYRVFSGSSDGEVRVWQVWVSSSSGVGSEDNGEVAMESHCCLLTDVTGS